MKKYNVPKLIDILKIKTNKIILIEIKEPNIDHKRLVILLNKYSKLNIYVCSFYNSIIKKISEEKHNFKLGVLNYVLNSEYNYHYYDFICILKNIYTDTIKNFFENNNIEIFIYGNNKKQEYDIVNFYIVDYKNIKSTHK